MSGRSFIAKALRGLSIDFEIVYFESGFQLAVWPGAGTEVAHHKESLGVGRKDATARSQRSVGDKVAELAVGHAKVGSVGYQLPEPVPLGVGKFKLDEVGILALVLENNVGDCAAYEV